MDWMQVPRRVEGTTKPCGERQDKAGGFEREGKNRRRNLLENEYMGRGRQKRGREQEKRAEAETPLASVTAGPKPETATRATGQGGTETESGSTMLSPRTDKRAEGEVREWNEESGR